MTFASRQDAGRQLGRELRERNLPVDVVVGLPRGGMVVAAEVARALRCPLDVLIVRKIGHPLNREFAIGALAERDVFLIDESALGNDPTLQLRLQQVIDEESGRLRDYEARFHCGERLDYAGKNIVLIDDGLATGATAEAA